MKPKTRPKIRKILFATDMSKNADLAFYHAAGLAEDCDATVTVLHVFEPIPPNAQLLVAAYLGYQDPVELQKKSPQQVMARIQEKIEEFCSQVSTQIPACRFILSSVLVEPGQAAERILFHAGRGEFDVLVMGSRGRGLVRETLMGGTSRKVLQKCPIPAFIIPMRDSD
ncbi:MAG: universal stress protein [Desulfatibacillaceae bacterium]|nr:universal stress protein [Desulfatibacillaceae bacterium]